MSSEMITLRVTPEQKAELELLANQRGCSVSDILRAFIDGMGKQIAIEVPEDCAAAVALCAELKEQSIPEFVRGYVTHQIQRDINDDCYSIILWKIRALLSEPKTKDELAELLPDEIKDIDYYLNQLVLYKYAEKTPDGKYQLKRT